MHIVIIKRLEFYVLDVLHIGINELKIFQWIPFIILSSFEPI
mgnify:CR=1 FL=1